jgi:outer membrane receptor protein involved in Fe transport
MIGLPFAFMLLSAQDSVVQGPTIVVTGRGLGEARGEAAYDEVLIGRDRLEHSASNRLEDVLRDIAGFQQFRRSDARSANPTSQGATMRGLGGNASSRTLLILDGVPQADPFGGWISWPAYDPIRLGQIRAVRGGGTGADGPGALAGVISLESAGPDEASGPAASLSYGSGSAVDVHAGYGARIGGAFVRLSAAHVRGDGFVPVVAEQRGAADRSSPYQQSSLALRALTPLGGTVELQANISGFRDERERGTAFSEISTTGADASLRLVGHGVLAWSALAYIQIRDFANRFAAVSADRATATLSLNQYSVPATGRGLRVEIRPIIGPATLRLGTDLRLTEGRTQELYQFVAGAPTRRRVAGGASQTLGAFAEAAWDDNSFTLTAGARLDAWRLTDGRLRERSLATNAPITDIVFTDRSGIEPTARAGITWRPSPMLMLRSAAYLGWRLPTLNELYRPFRIGTDATAANAALAPERLEGAEVGLDWRPTPSARLAITIFANRLSDAIANVTIGQGPGNFPGVGFVAAGGQVRVRQNVDAIRSKGVEVDSSFNFGPWHLTAGYSFADAHIIAEGSAALLDGLRPAQTPRHNFSAMLSWQGHNGAYGSIGGRYTSRQYEDDLNRQRLPGALTIDALFSLSIGRGLSISARAENLSGESVIAGVSGGGILERATPRTLWLGLGWRG